MKKLVLSLMLIIGIGIFFIGCDSNSRGNNDFITKGKALPQNFWDDNTTQQSNNK